MLKGKCFWDKIHQSRDTVTRRKQIWPTAKLRVQQTGKRCDKPQARWILLNSEYILELLGVNKVIRDRKRPHAITGSLWVASFNLCIECRMSPKDKRLEDTCCVLV